MGIDLSGLDDLVGRSEQAKRATLDDDGHQVVIESGARTDEPSLREWADLVALWGYDFDDFEVDEDKPMRIGGHTQVMRGPDGEPVESRLRNFRICLRRKRAGGGPDVDELVAALRRRRPVKAKAAKTSAAMVIALSDWQLGKGEADGTEGTVGRIQTSFEAKLARVKALRPETVLLAGLGDLLEGCFGNYANQPNSVDLSNREQMRLAANLWVWMVDELVRAGVGDIVCSSVPSNHGEYRTGKQATATDPLRDNRDLELLDNIAAVFRSNSRYENVRCVQPNDRWPETCMVQLDGATLAMHHGHWRKSGDRMKVALDWWKENEFNRRGAAGADFLLFAHGHHLLLNESTINPACQAPASDPGSEWFSANSGTESLPGMVSFLFGRSLGRRVWAEFHVD